MPHGPVRRRPAAVISGYQIQGSAHTGKKGKECVNPIYLCDSRLYFGKLAECLVNESSILNALWIIDAVALMANVLLYEVYMGAPKGTICKRCNADEDKSWDQRRLNWLYARHRWNNMLPGIRCRIGKRKGKGRILERKSEGPNLREKT